MMSAPWRAMTAAWATALSGSRNSPPSEKESGVTLRMPMTSGRPSERRAESVAAGDFSAAGAGRPRLRALLIPVALRGRAGAVKQPRAASVGDLERQQSGVLDPAFDDLFRWQLSHDLAFFIGVGHRARKVLRVSIFKFLDRVDTSGLQQLGIFLADALDAHAVGDIGPAQKLPLVEAGFFREHLAPLHGARGLKQPICRPDPHRLEDRSDVAVDPVDIGYRIGHSARLLRAFLLFMF